MGSFKRQQKPSDVKNLIESNLYIFKENIKIIISSVVDQICLSETQGGRIEHMLIKEYNKSKFEEIVEVDESMSDCNSAFSSAKNSNMRSVLSRDSQARREQKEITHPCGDVAKRSGSGLNARRDNDGLASKVRDANPHIRMTDMDGRERGEIIVPLEFVSTNCRPLNPGEAFEREAIRQPISERNIGHSKQKEHMLGFSKSSRRLHRGSLVEAGDLAKTMSRSHRDIRVNRSNDFAMNKPSSRKIVHYVSFKKPTMTVKQRKLVPPCKKTSENNSRVVNLRADTDFIAKYRESRKFKVPKVVNLSAREIQQDQYTTRVDNGGHIHIKILNRCSRSVGSSE